MRANYHTHTPRCRHAVGAERAYIERALAGGLELLGFSDHAPFTYADPGYDSGVRMFPEELEGYVDTLAALRAEYAGRIELHIGLEAEYYPALFPQLLDRLRGLEVEYLLLGQHFLGNELGEPYCGRPTADRSTLDRYVSQSIEGMDTGAFSCFAHPDLIRFVGDAAEYDRQMHRLCRAAAERNIPLELNLLGLREGRNYPDERFWRIAGEVGNSVILGCDAHRPEHAWDPESEARALALAERCSLLLADTLTLVSPVTGASCPAPEN